MYFGANQNLESIQSGAIQITERQGSESFLKKDVFLYFGVVYRHAIQVFYHVSNQAKVLLVLQLLKFRAFLVPKVP